MTIQIQIRVASTARPSEPMPKANSPPSAAGHAVAVNLRKHGATGTEAASDQIGILADRRIRSNQPEDGAPGAKCIFGRARASACARIGSLSSRLVSSRIAQLPRP